MREGQLNLKQAKYAEDLRPIEDTCDCSTCKTYTRAYLHHIVRAEPIACSLLSVHNVSFQLRLMKDIRQSIVEQRFPEFIKTFMELHYQNETIPTWIKDALKAVNVDL